MYIVMQWLVLRHGHLFHVQGIEGSTKGQDVSTTMAFISCNAQSACETYGSIYIHT